MRLVPPAPSGELVVDIPCTAGGRGSQPHSHQLVVTADWSVAEANPARLQREEIAASLAGYEACDVVMAKTVLALGSVVQRIADPVVRLTRDDPRGRMSHHVMEGLLRRWASGANVSAKGLLSCYLQVLEAHAPGLLGRERQRVVRGQLISEIYPLFPRLNHHEGIALPDEEYGETA